MKPEEQDQEEIQIRRVLREVFPPMGHAVELRRDLWPAMERRIAGPPRTVPWYDWALAAAVLALAIFFPKMALLFAYHL